MSRVRWVLWSLMVVLAASYCMVIVYFDPFKSNVTDNSPLWLGVTTSLALTVLTIVPYWLVKELYPKSGWLTSVMAVVVNIMSGWRFEHDRPPTSAMFLLALIAPAEQRDAIIGCAEETLVKMTNKFGRRRARAIFWWDFFRSVGCFVLRVALKPLTTVISHAFRGGSR